METQQKTRRVQVTMTDNCYRVVKQYAALRGMTMSECFYLALRYSLHREALEESDVRRLLERNDVPFDEGIKRKWQHELAVRANLDAVFTPRPDNLIP